MTDKTIQLAAKAVLMNRQKEFNDFLVYYFPIKPEKNVNTNLCVFKSFQYAMK